MSAGELAACERVQPPSMTKVLANLEERGLVRREAHPTDKRQAIISVTDDGLALLDRRTPLARRVAHASGWPNSRSDERALLRSVVPILDKLAEQ